MTQRKYTLDEISDMRKSVGAILVYEKPNADTIERCLQTYMQNDVDPDVLREYAAPGFAEIAEREEWNRAILKAMSRPRPDIALDQPVLLPVNDIHLPVWLGPAALGATIGLPILYFVLR